MSAASPPELSKGQDAGEVSTAPALLPSPLPDLPASSGSSYPLAMSHRLALQSQLGVSRQNAHQLAQLPESANEQEGTQQPVGFAPFFTLIEDGTTGEHHHPHVHYIFADDDPDLVTNTILQELEQVAESEALGDSASVDGEQDPQRHKVKRRTLLIDIGANGASVEGFKSLTHAWQLSSASVALAPTFNETGAVVDGPEKGEAGLMLRLEGVENESSLARLHDNDDEEYPSKAPTAEELFALSRRTEGGGDALVTMAALYERLKRDMESLSKLLRSVPGETEGGETLDNERGLAMDRALSINNAYATVHDDDL